MGFEPTTLGTTIQCSNQLSYQHHFNHRERFRFSLSEMRRKSNTFF